MKAVATTVAVAAVAALLPSLAAAHPRLATTTPAAGAQLDSAPREVVVRLSEPADPVGAGIAVTAPDGREAGRGAVIVRGATLTRSIAPAGRGSYLVEWLVVGDDTHPERGAFLFSVGEPTRTALPEPGSAGVILQALGRWLSLAGLALGFGVPLAGLLSGELTVRLWRMISAGVVLILIAEPIALLGQMATLAPSRMFDPGFAEEVFLTNYGHLAALRLGAGLGLWALAGALRPAAPRSQWALPAAGVAVALVHAGSAHRLAGLPRAAPLLLAATHVAAFAAWFGCIAVALAERRGRQLTRPALLAALALVLSGSGLALANLGSPSDLLETAYGATLGVKLALVAAAFALGAAARRQAELTAALLVLAAASLLVSLTPPA